MKQHMATCRCAVIIITKPELTDSFLESIELTSLKETEFHLNANAYLLPHSILSPNKSAHI
jgi:hypothetical protein